MANSSRMNIRRALAVATVACALGAATVAVAQETTGRLSGLVTMKSDQSPLPGVSVEAIHVPTGTRYTALTQSNGRFSILNVRVGGPYTVTAQISGFRVQTQKDINVGLGENRQVTFALELESVTESVVVTAEATSLISPDRMGSVSAMPEEQIKALPTVRRQIQDFARTNPLFNTAAYDESGTVLAVAGKNNRYNTIQIDGAVNNDLFGLVQHRHPGRPDRHAADQPRLGPGDPARRLPLRRQAGRLHGRRHQRHHPWRLQRVPRLGLRLDPQPELGRQQGPAGDGRPDRQADRELRREAVRRAARREDPHRQALLLRQRRDGTAARRRPACRPTARRRRRTTSPADAATFRNTLINRYGYDPGSLGDFGAKTDSEPPLRAPRLQRRRVQQRDPAAQLRRRGARLGRRPVDLALPVRDRDLHDRRQDELDGPPGQQRLRRQLVQHGPRRLPDHPRRPHDAGELPDRDDRPEHRLPVRSIAGHRALLRREHPRPEHPRGHRRLHADQGQPHDHDRDAQRVLRLQEPLPARLLRPLPLRHERGLRQGEPGRGRVLDPVRHRLRSEQARRPSPRSSGASTSATSGGSATTSR